MKPLISFMLTILILSVIGLAYINLTSLAITESQVMGVAQKSTVEQVIPLRGGGFDIDYVYSNSPATINSIWRFNDTVITNKINSSDWTNATVNLSQIDDYSNFTNDTTHLGGEVASFYRSPSPWSATDTTIYNDTVGISVGINTSEPNLMFHVEGGHINVTGASSNSSFTGDVTILGTLYGGTPVKIAGVNITDNLFSHMENTNSSLRFTLQNTNDSTNATAVISTKNDVGGSMSIGIGSSSFLLESTDYSNATALFSRSIGKMVFANFFNQPFIWLNNPSDDNDPANLIEVMRLTAAGYLGIGTSSPDVMLHITEDAKFESKLDIGVPGSGGGLDVGEGGSYTTDKDGTTIVQAFSYDASASSGSRFTEFTNLTASNTWLGDAGDRFYVGSTLNFWAVRFSITTGKTDELLQVLYYDGSSLINTTHMGILKDSATSSGQNVLNQTAEKEYITWDYLIKDGWSAADNILNTVPDGSSNMFWVAFEVPGSGFSTVPVVDEIKVRGTDFDIVSGASYPVFWGDARVIKHERIPLTIVKSPGGTTTTNIDIDSSHQETVFNFNGAGDNIAFVWILPEAIDTSSMISVDMDYAVNAADTYEINLTASKLFDGTAIGSGITPDFSSNVSIVAAAGDTFYTGQILTPNNISIQDMAPDDIISFEIERTDATNSIYPISVTIHYIAFSTGEHV